MNGSYTWEELIELGCPPGLAMQYIFMSKEEINSMMYNSAMNQLIEEMSK